MGRWKCAIKVTSKLALTDLTEIEIVHLLHQPCFRSSQDEFKSSITRFHLIKTYDFGLLRALKKNNKFFLNIQILVSKFQLNIWKKHHKYKVALWIQMCNYTIEMMAEKNRLIQNNQVIKIVTHKHCIGLLR